MKALEEKYLEGLSELFPSIAAASTEIINLQAIVNLPKGTEHFLTDIHGEYEAFAHVLKNGSGSVKRKVDDVFANTMSSRDKQTLATLIYYPREKMERIRDCLLYTSDTQALRCDFQKFIGIDEIKCFFQTEDSRRSKL